jgi:hypothetical protein
MKHYKLISRLPLRATTDDDGGLPSNPFEAKVQFMVDLVDRGVTWVFQKRGGAL